MILAMHHLQVACLVRHGRTAALNRYVADVAELQLLLASATTEVHIGGRLRASSCALLPNASGFVLEKDAPVVSYGSYADAILVTARRTPHSAEGDQVLVVCPAASTKLEQRSEWDALGMRGTCSHGYRIAAEGPLDHVLADPFADIAEQTMLPAAHVLWGYVWLGVAAAATTKARRHIQAQARKHPGSTPAGSTRMAELMVAFRTLEAVVQAAACRYEATPTGRQPKLAGSIAYNGVKVAASQAVVEIVTQAMSLCGIAGYQEGTPYSLGRHLRDAHGSVVMVSNERILGDNAHLLLGDREEI
jgi:acyl-CoA dehydrogenase